MPENIKSEYNRLLTSAELSRLKAFA